MLDAQARGNLANRGFGTAGQAMHQQHQLVMLRLQAVFPGGDLSEVDKLTDLPAKLGQILVLTGGKIRVHYSIVSRYILGYGSGRAHCLTGGWEAALRI